jgi:hypothetical protein
LGRVKAASQEKCFIKRMLSYSIFYKTYNTYYLTPFKSPI